VTLTVIEVPALALAVAGALTSGARSTPLTTIVVVAEPERALLAVNVTTWEPDWAALGVQDSVPPSSPNLP
jgi:hypothetical protein